MLGSIATGFEPCRAGCQGPGGHLQRPQGAAAREPRAPAARVTRAWPPRSAAPPGQGVPIGIPAAKTSAPPGTTRKAARGKGLCMRPFRIQAIARSA
jgi:hypothetical protein